MPEKPTLYRANGPSRKQVSEGSSDRKADKRFYASKRWRTLREAFLSENPLCVCDECKASGRDELADDVDHIIDRKVRPDLAYEWSNLQAMKHAHHSKKTLKTMRQGGYGVKSLPIDTR